MVLSRLWGFGIQLDLRVRFAYLEEKEAIEEAEGLHLGLLSSKDGMGQGLAGRLVIVKVGRVRLH
jgi:hypothetical protein